jgi:hypothetical protein
MEKPEERGVRGESMNVWGIAFVSIVLIGSFVGLLFLPGEDSSLEERIWRASKVIR